MKRITKTAGGVVVNRKGEVVVVSQRGDSWALPKGHLDPGEDGYTAAVREIREETGITDLTFVRRLGAYERHKIGRGGVGEDTSDLKEIEMFFFTTDAEGPLTPEDPDNPEARFVEVDAVSGMLTHPKDAAFFESVKEQLHP